ncbi:MAG TPA: hypothetical protein VIY53_11710 [Acidobacteriaceae bacterium]
MKLRACVLLAASLCSAGLLAQSPGAISKESALARLHSCTQGKWSDRECSNLNASLDVLIDAYRSGDKSVLPELFNFSYLTEFFDDAILSDPDGFLSALGTLPAGSQKAIAEGAAGEPFRALRMDRCLALKAVFEAVPASSPNRVPADICLRALKEHNASLFLDYFPPDTFTGSAAKLKTYQFSRVLYGFDESPLWRNPPDSKETWRFTYIGTWGRSRTVTLSVRRDGTGTVQLKWRDPETGNPPETGNLHVPAPIEISADQVRRFYKTLRKAEFWEAPSEVRSKRLGLDGAEWLLEGVTGSRYHLVTRWCPGVESKSVQSLAFADACRLLLEFASDSLEGEC